jgi:hypothetical protein
MRVLFLYAKKGEYPMAVKKYTYQITSDIGKTVAQNMRAGDTHTASDGSTWRKNTDGSISVTTKSGNTYGTNYGATSTGSTPAKKTLNTVYNQSTGQLDDASQPAWIPKAGDMAGYGSIGKTGAITASDYYTKALEEQQRAIQERTNQAVEANNAYIPQIQGQSKQALQNAYIANQQARVRTPQALNALGYSGGAAESTLLGLDTNYQNARGTIEQERSRALEGIRQNEAQIRSTGDATLADAAASYYDNLVTAAQQAEARAQDQANWESEFALQEKQYSDAAAQQAWQNAYDERMFQQQYSPQTQANYAQAAGANADASRRAPTSSGNYNTVWANVQRALGGSNAGSQRSFDAVINYIQNSLRSGMITENEAQQMLGRLNL